MLLDEERDRLLRAADLSQEGGDFLALFRERLAQCILQRRQAVRQSQVEPEVGSLDPAVLRNRHELYLVHQVQRPENASLGVGTAEGVGCFVQRDLELPSAARETGGRAAYRLVLFDDQDALPSHGAKRPRRKAAQSAAHHNRVPNHARLRQVLI